MKHQRRKDKTAVGTEITRRREAVNMTIEQLAAQANLQPDWLLQLERGKLAFPIDASLLLRVAEALHTTIADLCGLPIVRINEKGEFYRE